MDGVFAIGRKGVPNNNKYRDTRETNEEETMN